MKITIPLYTKIETKVKFLCEKLKLTSREQRKGRPALIPVSSVIAMSIFKQRSQIATKKALFDIFKEKLSCTYKTLVVSMIRYAKIALALTASLYRWNEKDAHVVKHVDATDIPVCSNRKAKNHKTMKEHAGWSKTGKGWFYGLKLHITTDLKRQMLRAQFTTANVDDRKVMLHMNEELYGIFVGDAGYSGASIAKEFAIEHKRILFAKQQPQMRKITTSFQSFLYGTRMLIELNFRSLKMFYGLVTSMPRSVNGYFANYIYSLLAYQIA